MNSLVIRRLDEALFGARELAAYAVLDGASIPGLRRALWQHSPEHVCLFRGDLAPDMATVAPYLVSLHVDDPFTRWVIEEGWGNHWGIFVTVPLGLPFRDLRKHFRQFLMVKSPEGKQVYFRYYDPRVLQAFLPTCNRKELRIMFGPVAWYMAETREGKSAVRMSCPDGSLRCEPIEAQRVGAEV